MLPGGPQRVQGYLLDISERKRLEEAPPQSQRMDAIWRWPAASHPISTNILTAIQG